MDLDELRAQRQALNNDVLLHAASVGAFRAEGQPWFMLKLDEAPVDDEPVRHLSTSASCFESLADVPDHQKGYKEARSTLADTVDGFTVAALERSSVRWQSEGAAEVYSRVRTLPILLAQAGDEALEPFAAKLRNHVTFVWDQLDPKLPEAQGIAEKVRKPSSKKDVAKHSEQRYPPNSFHTCWALRLIYEYERRRSAKKIHLRVLPREIEQKRTVALLWCGRTLSAQTALIRGEAQSVDAQQLAWALIADYEGRVNASEGHRRDAPGTVAGEHRELYASALDAFFSQQSAHGSWPLYEPLFHFPRAGNAYCYSFETLAELLRPALLHREGRELRELLRPHLPNLIRARDLAARTKVELKDGGVGWCSGHHPHRRVPEAWATAAVFSYLQALRRLVGHWAADAARDELAVRKFRYSSRRKAEEALGERGRTWTDGAGLSVGRELAGLFVHPIQAQASERAEVDPDRPLIPKDDARSAILFGPPGTGKTTLVEAVAGAIGWDFVEVPASAFVSEGLDQVPARAESIFTQLMELDRCVVLFDEVDELIRGRRGDDSDPFGRFLTTSMLPKLARLWEQRRVLFFVATNNVDKADPAIRRSQRFDAAIFTAPSSFDVKRKRLGEFGVELPDGFELKDVEKALDTKVPEDPIGVFALLRWDQIPELASRVTVVPGDDAATLASLEKALQGMGDELHHLEYHDEDSDGKTVPLFDVWRAYRANARRDFGRPLVARADALPDPLPGDWEPFASSNGATYVDLHAATDALDYDGDRCELRDGNGYLAVDEDGLLSFAKDETAGEEA